MFLRPAHAGGQHLLHITRAQPVSQQSCHKSPWLSQNITAPNPACPFVDMMSGPMLSDGHLPGVNIPGEHHRPVLCLLSTTPRQRGAAELHVGVLCICAHLTLLCPPTPTGIWWNRLSAILDLTGFTSSSVRSALRNIWYGFNTAAAVHGVQ